MEDLYLPRKLTVKKGEHRLILQKKRLEKSEHVIMKALLWAAHIEQYPQLQVEVSVGERYKPDLVAKNENGDYIFWAEAGRVKPKKVVFLAQKFPAMKLVLARWGNGAKFLTALERKFQAIKKSNRSLAKVELWDFAPSACRHCIDKDGFIHLSKESWQVIRVV